MLSVQPLTIKAANRLVKDWHRHSKPVRGALFAVGLSHDGELCGAAIIGRPIAKAQQDGYTAEVVRLVTDGTKNACSRLYGAACRAGFSLGYKRVLTYTKATESGVSLRAAGFTFDGVTRGGKHSRPSRPRFNEQNTGPKHRWKRVAA